MFKKNFKAIFVISGVLASVWKVFIKFHWHGQNTTYISEPIPTVYNVSFDNFIKGAEICAPNISSVEEYLELVDYKIEDILTYFMLGSDLKVFNNQMDQYWHKVLDYKYGFCYSFEPPGGEGVIKMSDEPAALNMAILLLNVSS